MTYQTVNTLMAELASSLHCDYAYSAFKDGLRNRFLIFYYPGNDDLYADGVNYQEIAGLTIEFYAPTKEINSETIIQNTLSAYGLTYDKTSVFISSEALNLTTYTMEVLINGEQSQVQSV